MSKPESSKESKGKSTLQNIIFTYRSEFAKIVWPGRPELLRKTITVAIISAMFGAYIAGLDFVLAAIFSSFVGFLG